MGNEELFAVIGDLLNRQAHRRHRHIDDQIDFVDVIPLPRDAGGNIGLDLVVGGYDADRLAQNLTAKIFGGHLRCGDRTGTGRRRCGPG